jgi:uncharacterized membrane protein YfcA
LGTGGGVFLVPLLVLAFDVPIHYAVAASLVTVIATSSTVASVNVERGTANMRLGMVLEIATSVGAILGGLTAGWLSAALLETIFGVILLPTALLMWRNRVPNAERMQRAIEGIPEKEAARCAAVGWLGDVYYDPLSQRVVAYRVQHLPAGFGISVLAGAVSGLLGIGGGIFKVPALHLLCNIPMKAAAATSNFMIGVTAAASSFLYFGRGEVQPAMTSALVLGVLAGSAVGSVWNQSLHGRFVRRLFALLLIVVALQFLYRAWSSGVLIHG